MRRFKTVEELNMEVTVEPTVEEKTQAFKAWVVKKIGVCETTLTTDMHNLDYWLNQREPVNDELFNRKFEIEYFFINNDMRDAESYCKENGISNDVLADTIKEFKQMKSKVRKVKSEYKQKFIELKAAIEEAKENEEYVAAVTSQVQELITNWCSTYVILDYRKPDFEGDRLSRNIAFVTNWILSSRLNPSKDEVVEFVEKFMRNNTETVAC